MAVARRPRTSAEARADAILDDVSDADVDALAACLANLLISAARSGRRWRTLSRPADDTATDDQEAS